MAHQASSIPWHDLAANLYLARISECSPGWGMDQVTNLFAREDEQRRDENNAILSHFVDAFVNKLREQSASERAKYPENYNPPESTDVILDKRIVKEISPTVRRWRRLFV